MGVAVSAPRRPAHFTHLTSGRRCLKPGQTSTPPVLATVHGATLQHVAGIPTWCEGRTARSIHGYRGESGAGCWHPSDQSPLVPPSPFICTVWRTLCGQRPNGRDTTAGPADHRQHDPRAAGREFRPSTARACATARDADRSASPVNCTVNGSIPAALPARFGEAIELPAPACYYSNALSSVTGLPRTPRAVRGPQ